MKYYLSFIQLNLCLLAFLFISLVAGCKKDSSSDSKSDDGRFKVIFAVAGVSNPDAQNIKPLGSISPANYSTESQLSTVLKFDNFDLEGQSQSQTISTALPDAALIRPGIQSKNGANIASVSAMKTGVTYRILLYNTTTQVIEQSVLATAGTAVEIDVVKGQAYKYYAYSYNNSEQIPAPDPNNLTIETSTDKNLLYASGDIQASVNNTVLNITFVHKVAELVVELDTDRLFGKIESYNIAFTENNYLNKGTLSLTTGQVTNITTYTKGISFTDSINANLRVARFYVADPSQLTTLKVSIFSMSGKYLNNQAKDFVVAGNTQELPFTFVSPVAGSRLTAKIKLWYKFANRTILHVTRSGVDAYGYAAQPNLSGSDNGASYNMLNTARNFGSLTNSVVRAGSFTHIRCSTNGTMHTFLANKPDITIISVYYEMSANDRTALLNYVRSGGVVLLMTDGVNTTDRSEQQPFFRDLFNNQTITLQNNGYGAGALYLMVNIDDEILNGPFGDARNKYWGEDASATTTLANIPIDSITAYSEAKAANGTAAPNGVTMFKHKTKHFFWIGDGGFLSNELDNGRYISATIEPFATVNTVTYPNTENPTYNYNNFPIPKINYGAAGNGIASSVTPVYNSVIFGNIMSWAIVNAEFFGINTGGIPPNYVDF